MYFSHKVNNNKTSYLNSEKSLNGDLKLVSGGRSLRKKIVTRLFTDRQLSKRYTQKQQSILSEILYRIAANPSLECSVAQVSIGSSVGASREYVNRCIALFMKRSEFNAFQGARSRRDRSSKLVIRTIAGSLNDRVVSEARASFMPVRAHSRNLFTQLRNIYFNKFKVVRVYSKETVYLQVGSPSASAREGTRGVFMSGFKSIGQVLSPKTTTHQMPMQQHGYTRSKEERIAWLNKSIDQMETIVQEDKKKGNVYYADAAIGRLNKLKEELAAHQGNSLDAPHIRKEEIPIPQKGKREIENKVVSERKSHGIFEIFRRYTELKQ